MGEFAEDDVAGLLAAEQVVVRLHALIDEAVAHGGLFIGDARGVEGLVKAEIAHHGGDDRVARKLAAVAQIFGADIHDAVAVDDLALFVHGEAAVRVAVEGEAGVQPVFHHILLQPLNVRGAAAGVDVHAVRLGVDDVRLGAERIEHGAADHPRAAVRAVERDAVLFKRARRKSGQIADIAVAPGIKVHGLADGVPRRGRQCGGSPVQICLQLRKQRVVHLFADSVHQLDAVVVKGIVACGDHHAAVKIFRARDVADAGRRGHVEQICVRPGGGDARGECAFVHIRGTAGVLADDDLRPGAAALCAVIPAEEAADPECVLGGEVLPGPAAEAVRSEIFTHQIKFSFRIFRPRLGGHETMLS